MIVKKTSYLAGSRFRCHPKYTDQPYEPAKSQKHIRRIVHQGGNGNEPTLLPSQLAGLAIGFPVTVSNKNPASCAAAVCNFRMATIRAKTYTYENIIKILGLLQ